MIRWCFHNARVSSFKIDGMKVVAGNWKMNLTLPEAVELVKSIQPVSSVKVIVFPPALFAVPVTRHACRGIETGVQNIHHEDFGAYTGEVSAPMAVSIGMKYALVGHSERRHIFGETDEQVNLKVKKALEHGLKVIMCVGETLQERESGRAFEMVERQVREGLKGIDDLSSVMIAYEPVWAIGTGKNATPQQAQEMHEFIKKIVDVPVLYGGSVKPSNARELLSQKDVDGVLVGGASLKADSFNEIIRIASELS